MEYKRFTDKIFLRADRGEELVSAIVSVCEKENVRLASVSGIGAAGLIRAGYFDVAEKRYHVSEYRGDLEILSLLGNITEKDGEVYACTSVSQRRTARPAGDISARPSSAAREKSCFPLRTAAREEGSTKRSG